MYSPPAGGGSGAIKPVFVQGDGSGDYLTTSVAVGDIDAVHLAASVPAQVGDVLRCILTGFTYESDSAGFGLWGFNIGGADIMPTSLFVPWVSSQPPTMPLYVAVLHTVVLGDIVNKNVAVRARWKSTSGFHLRVQNSAGVLPVMSVERWAA